VDVPLRSRLALMRSEQIDVEMSTIFTGPSIFSPFVQNLTTIMIVKVVLFMDAGVCPTAGCAPRLESFYTRVCERLHDYRGKITHKLSHKHDESWERQTTIHCSDFSVALFALVAAACEAIRVRSRTLTRVCGRALGASLFSYKLYHHW
jgi:hypothetical protein